MFSFIDKVSNFINAWLDLYFLKIWLFFVDGRAEGRREVIFGDLRRQFVPLRIDINFCDKYLSHSSAIQYYLYLPLPQFNTKQKYHRSEKKHNKISIHQF